MQEIVSKSLRNLIDEMKHGPDINLLRLLFNEYDFKSICKIKISHKNCIWMWRLKNDMHNVLEINFYNLQKMIPVAGSLHV